MAEEFGSITEPSEDIKMLTTTCRDLKRVVEMLIGQRGTSITTASALHVSREQPDYQTNALWVKPAVLPGEKNILSFANNGQWIVIISGP